jgi:cytochrome c553
MRVIVKKLFKWTGFVAAGLVAVALIAFAWLFFASEHVMNRRFVTEKLAAMAIPTDPEEVAKGHRIALLAGCVNCHGETLSGGVVDDIPNLVRIVAPNISVALPAYTDAQLVAVLRKGVKSDGHGALFMPSEMFRHLGDTDLARLIAYLRSVPATAEGVQEATEVRILGRLILATGDYKPAAVAIDTLPAPVTTFDPNDPVSHGRYLTMSFCSECHGQNLEGFAPINAPALTVAKAYSLPQFSRLMHDGVPLSEQPLRLMGPTSKARFSNFTMDEVAAVHAFLQARS